MSDNDKSGAPTSAPADLPAADPALAESARAPFAAASAGTPSGAFGATRGSGLARGKRPAQPAASSTVPASTGYKPTAVEVITPQSEYKNPFTGETTVPSVSPVNEPQPAIAAAKADAPQVEINTPQPAAPLAPRVNEEFSKRKVADPSLLSETAKSELKILPPESSKREAVSWDASGNEADAARAQPQSRRDERATFRTDRERREQRPFEPREPRDPQEPRASRDSREPRREDRKFEPREERKFEPRTHQPYRERQPQPTPQKKSGGFLGWLKGLFGGSSIEARPTTDEGGRRDGERDREHGHRGHRGGRGRGRGNGGFRGENRGPRPDGQPGAEFRPQGEFRGEGDQGGQRRRRRRGGRGRGQGGGGGFRDDNRGPRPEGQQGGGAI